MIALAVCLLVKFYIIQINGPSFYRFPLSFQQNSIIEAKLALRHTTTEVDKG